MRISIILTLLFWVSFFFHCVAQSPQSKVDPQKNIVFTIVLEELPATDEEIILGVAEHLKKSYKETRYTISTLEPHSIIGEGQFNSFFQSENMVKSRIFNLPFQLRVDTKGNRARLLFIARNYEIVELSDIGDKKTTLVLISEAENTKLYKKAFKELESAANRTLESLSETIKAISSKPTVSDDW